MSRTLVYAGPTLTAEEIHRVRPGIEVRPPAGRGDLLAEAWEPGDTAVIIDGYFRDRRSVGHKEILHLLREGVAVLGAGSMGALRAAELSAYGMRGVGAVHRMYAEGVIDGDDEVGVLHGPADVGYPALTVALVNLRHALARTAAPAVAQRLIAGAKSLPFTSRTWEELARGRDAEESGALSRARALIEAGPGNVKRLDALAALTVQATAAVPPEVPVTGITRHQLLVSRTREQYAPGRWRSDPDMLDAARLFDPEYPVWHEQVLSGLLPADPAVILGVTEDEPLPAPLAVWLTARERATLPFPQQVRLVTVRVWPVWQSTDWRPAMIERLRATDRWQRWRDLVAEADEVADRTRFRQPVPPPAACAAIFLRHWRGEGPAEIAMARRGFTGREELGGTVRRFFPYDVRRARSQPAAPR
ncbi:TfuA-like protein [Actinoplanes sp. NPDC020271]|uniref:TfuA-like protein n=1 Tax=Actinoplanes sp. NPDC020271 TaxID=3363896 RepID=UPI0037B8B818